MASQSLLGRFFTVDVGQEGYAELARQGPAAAYNGCPQQILRFVNSWRGSAIAGPLADLVLSLTAGNSPIWPQAGNMGAAVFILPGWRRRAR